MKREQKLLIFIPYLIKLFSEKNPLIAVHISTCVGVAALNEIVSIQTPRTFLQDSQMERSTWWNKPLGSLGLDGRGSLFDTPNLHARLTYI